MHRAKSSKLGKCEAGRRQPHQDSHDPRNPRAHSPLGIAGLSKPQKEGENCSRRQPQAPTDYTT